MSQEFKGKATFKASTCILQTGDYNKPIPAQYDDRLNHPAGCDQEEFISGDELLCNRCSQNQLLKVKQLANFVPYTEVSSRTECYLFHIHYVNVSVLIKFSQNTSVFTLIIISSP